MKKKNELDNARINAVITITFSLYVNFMNFFLILLVAFKGNIFKLPEQSLKVNIVIVIFLILIGILNYLILGREKQHKRIVDKFYSNDYKKKQIGVCTAVIYLLLTFGIPLSIFLFITL